MEITILNTNLEAVGVIDEFISTIWTGRYDEAGDFEIHLPMNAYSLDRIKEDYYLVNRESEHVMIIEDINMTTDVEEGKRIKITGSSLEKILDRRIIWNKTSFARKYASSSDLIGTKPNLQEGIKKLLNENIISPAIAARRISNFIFEESTDPAITELTFEAQYYGESLYEVISSLCKANNIGFKITLNANNQFVFKLYAGADRSYGTDEEPQIKNPYVIFSPDNDNLYSSNFYIYKSSYKNVVLVSGEVIESTTSSTTDETVEKREFIVVGNELGINRRETFADGSDISSEDSDEDSTISDDQRYSVYKAQLKQRGIDTLIENLRVEAFDGEVEATVMYTYGDDFFMGDIVQLEDEYGHTGRARVSEFIMSQDKEGIKMYPTFTTIQKGDYADE